MSVTASQGQLIDIPITCLCVPQLQELEQQLAAGLPISKAANKVGSSDLQAVVAKLTYQEGCAALYDSAKEHIGVKKVHAK